MKNFMRFLTALAFFLAVILGFANAWLGDFCHGAFWIAVAVLIRVTRDDT